jgi:hypothetical protein
VGIGCLGPFPRRRLGASHPAPEARRQIDDILNAQRVIAPVNSEGHQAAASELNMPIIPALAWARGWQRLLEDGTYASMPELAKKEKISKSYVSRTLRLMLLAPDIIEAILDGRQPPTLLLDDLEGGFPVEWHLQRRCFSARLHHQSDLRARQSSSDNLAALAARYSRLDTGRKQSGSLGVAYPRRAHVLHPFRGKAKDPAC